MPQNIAEQSKQLTQSEQATNNDKIQALEQKLQKAQELPKNEESQMQKP